MSLFLFKELMKIITALLLFFSHSLTWANNIDTHELGRSLANYKACSKVSVKINDDQMFNYYQNMFNDTSFALLARTTEKSNQVYATWAKSERILVHIGEQSLQNICLSRFDELSRKMFNKVATK
jgi:hypothetical protein